MPDSTARTAAETSDEAPTVTSDEAAAATSDEAAATSDGVAAATSDEAAVVIPNVVPALIPEDVEEWSPTSSSHKSWRKTATIRRSAVYLRVNFGARRNVDRSIKSSGFWQIASICWESAVRWSLIDWLLMVRTVLVSRSQASSKLRSPQDEHRQYSESGSTGEVLPLLHDGHL